MGMKERKEKEKKRKRGTGRERKKRKSGGGVGEVRERDMRKKHTKNKQSWFSYKIIGKISQQIFVFIVNDAHPEIRRESTYITQDKIIKYSQTR